MENQLLKTLKNNKLFNGVDLAKIDFSLVKGKLLTVNEGKILYRNTDPATNVYFVVSGEVNILNKELSKSGASLKIENDFFGQEEVVDGVSRYSTAVVLRDSYIISLTSEEFHSIIDQDDQFNQNMQTTDPNSLLDQIPDDAVEDHLPEPDLEKALSADNSFLDLGVSESVKESEEIELHLGSDIPASSVRSEGTGVVDLNINLEDNEIDEQLVEREEDFKFELNSIIEDELSDLSKVPVEKEETKTFKPEDPLDINLGNGEVNLEEQENEDEISLKDFDLETQLNNELEADQSINFDQFDLEKIQEESEIKKEEQKDEISISESEVDLAEESEKYIQEPVDEEMDENFNDIIQEKIEEVVVPPQVVEEFKIQEQQKFDSEIKPPADIDKTRLEMLIKAAELVNSDLRVDDVLDNIVKVASELANADRGTLYLVDKENNELWSKVVIGGVPKEIRLKIGDGIAGWVAKTSETVNIKDAKTDDRFNDSYDKSSGYVTSSMLCMPIKNKDRETVGVIQLLNSKTGAFTKLDEELINTISINCSLALENANMLEQLLKGERVSSLGKMANFLIQDIKKPVLVSKRYAEHLQNKDLPDDIKQVLEMMIDQINHVADIVQITSSYADGNTILRTMDTNIQTVLTDFAGRIESYIEQRNCKIDLKIEVNAPIKIDMKQFYQCFHHIVKNACDAMPEGGKISIFTSSEFDKINIHIKDEGLGIPETMQNKIFEPFMTYGKKDGTGLGLSITKKIIEDHAGSITFVSNLGEGTEFIVTLPENSPI